MADDEMPDEFEPYLNEAMKNPEFAEAFRKAEQEADEEDRAELVMPFLPVTSKGGPFDDQAYCAGYEMGLLDARLAAGPAAQGGARFLEATVLEHNREQADLLAMRHGYLAEFQHTDVEGWVFMQFTPTPTEETP